MPPEFKRSERVALADFSQPIVLERSEACSPGFQLLNLAAWREVASSERGGGREWDRSNTGGSLSQEA